MPDILLKRAYDTPQDADGARLLVDRVWPRGVARDRARLEAWLKGLAPSSGLRKWFGHDPGKWPEFRERYLAELRQSQPQDLERLKAILADQDRVTLVFAARDTEHNNAVALREFLQQGDI